MMNTAKVKRGPGRPGITYDEVAAAADSIRNEGGYPTYSEVRARLGKGSPKKLGEHMQRWWSEQDDAHARCSSYVLATSVVTAMQEEVAAQVAVAVADLGARSNSAQQDRLLLVKEVGELNETVDRLEDELSARQSELATRNGALNELRELLRHSTIREDALRKELALLETELLMLRNRAAQVETTGDVVSKLTERLTTSETMQATAAAQISTTIEQNDAIRKELAVLLSKLAPFSAANQIAAATQIQSLPAVSPAEVPRKLKTLQGPQCSPTATNATAPTSARQAILESARGLIREHGSVPIKAIRDELAKLKLPSVRAKALRNLASTLSKAPDLAYSREVQGWIIRASGNESQDASSDDNANH